MFVMNRLSRNYKEAARKFLHQVCPPIPVVRNIFRLIMIKHHRKMVICQQDIDVAETDNAYKKEITKKYIKKFTKKSNEIGTELRKYLNTQPKINAIVEPKYYLEDVLFNYFAYGFTPDEYFCFGIKDKTQKEKQKYISDRDHSILGFALNDPIETGVFKNKNETYRKLKKYYKREVIYIEKKNEEAFLEFVKNNKIFIKKKVDVESAKGIELVNIEKISVEPKIWYERLVSEGRYILEELVRQESSMAKLNPSSVNTVRAMAYQTKGGIIIDPCILRVGRAGSFVDNGAAGGIMIGLNSENGIAVTDGYDERLNVYKEHPDTHVVFRGIQIPQWNQLCMLVKEMTQIFPALHYIAWDLAYTNDGWVVIEGNTGGTYMLPQIVYQRGIKNDIYRRLNEKELSLIKE